MRILAWNLDLKNGDNCPSCKRGRLDEIKKDLTFPYKKGGPLEVFENEIVFRCNLCDGEWLPLEANKRIDAVLISLKEMEAENRI